MIKLLYTVIIVYVSGLSFSLAQHQVHDKPIAGNVLADGAKNPDLISDQTAIKIFFVSITEPSDAPPEAIARLKAKIRRMRLSDPDTETVIATVKDFHGRFSVHKAEADKLADQLRSKPDPNVRQQMTAASLRIDQEAMNCYQMLLRSLSRDGVGRLKAHLYYLKSRIKIIAPPKM